MTADLRRTLATRLLALRALKDAVQAADIDTRASALRHGFDIPGVRDIGVIGDEQIGAVQLKRGAESWRVHDSDALLKWVRDNAPDEVETSERVRPAFVTKLLASCKAGDFGVNETTGESSIPDGIDVTAGTPTLEVRPSRDAGAIIAAAVAEGRLDLAELTRREIEP